MAALKYKKIIMAAIIAGVICSLMSVPVSAIISANVDINQIAQILDYGYYSPYYYIWTDDVGVAGTNNGTYELSNVIIPYQSDSGEVNYTNKIGMYRYTTQPAIFNKVKYSLPIFSQASGVIQVIIPSIKSVDAEIVVRQQSYDDRFEKMTESNCEYKIIAVNNQFIIQNESGNQNIYAYYLTLIQIEFEPTDVISIEVSYEEEQVYQQIGVGIIDMQLYPKLKEPEPKDYTGDIVELRDLLLDLKYAANTTGESVHNIEKQYEVLSQYYIQMQKPKPSDQLKTDEIEDKKQQLQEEIEAIDKKLNSIEKPTIGELDIGGFIDDYNIAGDPSQTIISSILKNQYVLLPIGIVISVALISYIMYGKKEG